MSKKAADTKPSATATNASIKTSAAPTKDNGVRESRDLKETRVAAAGQKLPKGN